MAPPTQTSRILQNAFCFLPKEDDEEKGSVRGRVRPDHRRSNSALPSIYSSYKTDRRNRSGRRQQEQNGGEQQQEEAERTPTDQTAPRSSFGLLGDQLQSVSRRFANSINFLHSGSRREEPPKPNCWPTTDDGHRDSDGDGGITVEAIAVPDKERLQPPSFMKHIKKRSSDVDGEGKDELGTPVDPVAVGKKKPSASLSLMKLITRRTDEKPQLFDGVRSSLTRSRSSGSSLRLTKADEKAWALMIAPVTVADNYDVPGDPGIKPQQEQKQPHKNLSLGFHETSSEREESYPLPESTALQIKSNSQQETFLGAGIQRLKAALKVKEEEEDAFPQGKRSTLDVGLLHDNNTLMILPEEIDEPQQDEEVEGRQPFDFWHGTSLKSGSGSTDDAGPQVTPDLQPKTLSLISHNTPITTQENGKAQEYSDIESEDEGGPPFRFYLTSLNNDHEIGGGEEEGGDQWTRGSWSPGPRRITPDSHDLGRVLGVEIPSSLEDTEAACCLAEFVDNMPLGAEQKPQAGLVDFALNTGSRRRKVQLSGDDDGLTNFEGVAQHADLSETLLGKVVATKHHQVRYLQDELEQTRAQLADLELDCEAQKDLKLAFKVQAVRLGLALKKLRQFTLENGLDPSGVERKSPAGVSANAQPKEVGQASDTEHTTKEINSSPKLDLLKAEAKRFGWLCDPKEVELREYIGSGSSAEIFKALWHNVEVAVKCLRPSSFGGNTEEAIAAFCQEVEILSTQRHPYILRMFAACLSPPDRAWIVTEYLSSGTLTEWLHGTKSREKNRIAPLPPLSERLRIALEISIAMQSLHRLTPKVIHRDLKPSNILLDENKHVRIADFNCARRFTNEVAILTGETGTYVYMAPEVVCHEFYDHMCDIYSFAVILCELVTGNPPYIDTNYSPAEIACKVAQGTLRPTLPENRPTALLQLIQSAWEQDPRNRPSFSEITAKLNIIAKDFNGVEEPSTDPLAKALFYQ